MHSRRSFIKRTILAAAAATGASRVVTAQSSIAAGPDTGGIPMRVSVLAYSFHGMLEQGAIDLFGFLETCKYRYRLSAADLWNGFLKSTEEGYLKQIREGLDERELVVPNLACDDCLIWADDQTEREKYHQNALAHLKAAKILGARFVRFDAGGPPEGDRRLEWTDEEFDHILKRYREYAQ